MNAVVDDGSGNAEGGGIDLRRILVQEILNDFLQSGVLVALVALMSDANEFSILYVEQADIGLCTANVARKIMKLSERKRTQNCTGNSRSIRTCASGGHRFG